MKTLEKGQDKIKKICEVLRDETIDPAKRQGEELIQEAQKKAEKIIAEGQKAVAKMHENAKVEIENIKNAFDASLSQAAKQSLEALKQAVEQHFFNKSLSTIIEKKSADPQLVASLINAIVQALQKEGLSANLNAIIPETINPDDVNTLLLNDVTNALKGGTVEIGSFAGGAQIKLSDKKMTIDISDKALKDILSNYVVRKEFRKIVFES
jgi:V/A-type H+/Na+-transporting ATPase subunit E